MKRAILAAAIGVAYILWRVGMPTVLPAPTPTPTPSAPFSDVAALAASMAAEDRIALAQAYEILSRSIAANPVNEPVFPDTAAVRRAHRAALFYVWGAVLKNKAGEVAGLREALEGAVAQRIGTDDVPLNPELQKDTAKAFADLASSFR